MSYQRLICWMLFSTLIYFEQYVLPNVCVCVNIEIEKKNISHLSDIYNH